MAAVSEQTQEERSVYLVVVKDNVVVYHAYAGSNLLKDRLALIAEIDEYPLEKVDFNHLIETTTQIVYTTTSKFIATTFLLGLFDQSLEDATNLHNKFNLESGPLTTSEDLSFSFIVHY